MPSVLTHFIFNKEVYNDSQNDFLRDNSDIYLVGAQGPDPFFFYGIVPFSGNKYRKQIRKYGTMLHKINPSNHFIKFFKYANNSENKNILYAYILGMGMHYILDRKIHPFVFYKTGFSENKKLKKQYFLDHTKFETNIDVLLITNHFKNYMIKPYDSIKCDYKKVEIVSEMYYRQGSIGKASHIDENSFAHSYKHMRNVEKILYSKRGIKKAIVGAIFKNTPFNTMMHPCKVKDDLKIDYLNVKKKQWLDPSKKTQSNKSVYELLEEAKLEANKWESIVKSAYNGDVDEEKIIKFCDGKIYDGYDEHNEMKVFCSVYRKEKD